MRGQPAGHQCTGLQVAYGIGSAAGRQRNREPANGHSQLPLLRLGAPLLAGPRTIARLSICVLLWCLGGAAPRFCLRPRFAGRHLGTAGAACKGAPDLRTCYR
jgi:hypothetical protein